jgi:hypothetical protein
MFALLAIIALLLAAGSAACAVLSACWARQARRSLAEIERIRAKRERARQ